MMVWVCVCEGVVGWAGLVTRYGLAGSVLADNQCDWLVKLNDRLAVRVERANALDQQLVDCTRHWKFKLNVV